MKDKQGQEAGNQPSEVPDWSKHWEKVNRELQDKGGVNPHAYRLGFLDAIKFTALSQAREQDKEIWTEVIGNVIAAESFNEEGESTVEFNSRVVEILQSKYHITKK